jgi:hypothetical protein
MLEKIEDFWAARKGDPGRPMRLPGGDFNAQGFDGEVLGEARYPSSTPATCPPPDAALRHAGEGMLLGNAKSEKDLGGPSELTSTRRKCAISSITNGRGLRRTSCGGAPSADLRLTKDQAAALESDASSTAR